MAVEMTQWAPRDVALLITHVDDCLCENRPKPGEPLGDVQLIDTRCVQAYITPPVAPMRQLERIRVQVDGREDNLVVDCLHEPCSWEWTTHTYDPQVTVAAVVERAWTHVCPPRIVDVDQGAAAVDLPSQHPIEAQPDGNTSDWTPPRYVPCGRHGCLMCAPTVDAPGY